jgi:hypothetical protein
MAGATRTDAAHAAARVPGVYYEHRWGNALAQPASGTGIPVFVGFAVHRRGAQAAGSGYRLLHHWEHFDQVFHVLSADAYLRHAVKGFFGNGGTQCVVLPVGAAPDSGAAMAAALTAPFLAGGVLEDLTLIDLVCVPDLMMLAGIDAAASVFDVQNAVLDHCARMGDRFAILDALPDVGNSVARADTADAQQVEMALRHWEVLAAGHGALYFPWIRVLPLRDGGQGLFREGPADVRSPEKAVKVPPCGHVAGVYARTDLRAGPHHAPANELVHQVVRLDLDLSDAQLAALNDKGVNCLRSVPGRGLRVWGARTLSGEPGWRYVNIRRLFLTLARWAEHNCADLVFEANNAALWDRLAQRLRGYCHTLYVRGALAGTSPADAFHVKCDAETNRPASIAAGMVVAEVGLAPLVPAEFVVVRITQNADGLSVGVPSSID